MDFYKALDLLRNPKYWSALRRGVAATVEHRAPLKEITPKMVIDVGANKGQFSAFAAVQWPKAKIIAFEPIPGQADKYSETLGMRATLHRNAIGEKNAVMPLHIASRVDSSSLLALGVAQKHLFSMEETGTIEIDVKRLDNVLKLSEVFSDTLLKIDIQGYEFEALSGAIGLVDKIKWVYVEVSFVELYEGQKLYTDIENLLSSLGYTQRSINNLTYDESGNAVQGDILFERL